MKLKIIIKNLNQFGAPVGPWHVRLSASAITDPLGVVGYRVHETRNGWEAQPLCGPLAEDHEQMAKRSRTFPDWETAIEHAENEIRRWCAEMATMFGDVKEAA